MNYQNIYNALVEKAKVRGLDKSQHEGYFEIHHIVPRCLGGSDEKDNLVMFTGREHFIAHLVLAKLYPDVKGLTYAAFMMSSESSSSHHYEKLRNLVSNLNFENNIGKLKVDYAGHKIGRLTVLGYNVNFEFNGKRIPKWECLCECGNITYVATPYLKKKEILSCGCLLSETSRAKMLGIEKPENVRNKISETLKSKNLKPWQNTRMSESDKIKWLDAQHLFQMWSSSSCPKSMNFTKLYNKMFDTNFTRSYFKVIIGYFINGWIPLEDEDWLKFSKGA